MLPALLQQASALRRAALRERAGVYALARQRDDRDMQLRLPAGRAADGRAERTAALQGGPGWLPAARGPCQPGGSGAAERAAADARLRARPTAARRAPGSRRSSAWVALGRPRCRADARGPVQCELSGCGGGRCAKRRVCRLLAVSGALAAVRAGAGALSGVPACTRGRTSAIHPCMHARSHQCNPGVTYMMVHLLCLPFASSLVLCVVCAVSPADPRVNVRKPARRV